MLVEDSVQQESSMCSREITCRTIYGGTLWTPPSSSSEQVAEADRLFHVLRPAVEDALRRLTRLLASKPDDKLLGKTEFEVRDRVHAIGARAIETALNERNTGGTKGPA